MGRAVRVIAVIGTALTLLVSFGGPAAAKSDPLIGKKYSEASALISGWGADAVIETVIGSRLATDDCIVGTWSRSSFRDIDAKKRKGAILLNLNCNDSLASAGSPGNSATSAEGKLAKRNIKVGAWCALPDQVDNANCITFCKSNGELCVAT
jgi:hypothetical protein